MHVVYRMVTQTITSGAGPPMPISNASALLGASKYTNLGAHIGSSKYYTQKPDFNEKDNIVPLSVFIKNRGLSLFCIVKESRSNGGCAKNPRCCKRHRTVRAANNFLLQNFYYCSRIFSCVLSVSGSGSDGTCFVLGLLKTNPNSSLVYM